MKPLLVFATFPEAKSCIEGFALEHICEHLWASSELELIITGVGSLPAALSLQQHLIAQANNAPILNLGCCASLAQVLPFSLFSIQEVYKCQERVHVDLHSKDFFSNSYPSFTTTACPLYPFAKLISVDTPVHDDRLSQALSTLADLVDMEGYGLAAAANKAKRSITCIKCVSDFGRARGHLLIKQHLSQCSQKLFEAAQNWLQIGSS